MLDADLFEIAINSKRVPHILIVYCAKDVARDPAAFQKFEAAQGLTMCRFVASGQTISVMKLLRAVETEADAESFRRQEFTPLLIEQDAVCLHAVEDAFAVGRMLALQCNDLFEIVQAEQRGLSAVPGECDRGSASRGDMLNDVFLQQSVGHAQRINAGVKRLFWDVIAVVARQIAERPDRFDKDLKISGSLDHFSLRCLG